MRFSTFASRLLLPVCVALSLFGAGAAAQDQKQDSQAQRQQSQPYNNAPTWRDVRSGQEAYTSVKGPETGILIQSGGETWRQIRNGPVTVIGGWAVVAMLLVIGLFYKVKGSLALHEPPSGRQMQRFTDWERIVHWSTAISFCVLGISGLIILFGKFLLLPIIGYTLFAWLTQIATMAPSARTSPMACRDFCAARSVVVMSEPIASARWQSCSSSMTSSTASAAAHAIGEPA